MGFWLRGGGVGWGSTLLLTVICDTIIGSYEQAIKDTVPGRMVPCDEQSTKRGICFPDLGAFVDYRAKL